MTSETRNYIAGRWQDGAGRIENRNPSDLSDVIGHYAQASAAQLDEALAGARAAQPLTARSGCRTSVDEVGLARGNGYLALVFHRNSLSLALTAE